MPERILVVEDDENTRQLFVSMLAAADYDCREAGNGHEALAVLDSGEVFDLVLSNLMMPRMTGEELLPRLKDKYPDIPVIIETGVHDISIALVAIRNGAYDYLLKPFTREQLLATVRRALEYRRLKLENRTYQTNLEALVTARTEQLRQAVSTLERAYDITLDGFGRALAMKDAETELHCKRVTAFSIGIARSVGQSADRIREIARGAFLHDLGKLATPEAILQKPGALTSQEITIIRQHCLRGYEIVKSVAFLAEPAEIVYCHHENFDGTGYPRKLKAEAIPLGARVVAVANTLDVITSKQPYRPARALSAAKEELRNGAGRQFDPKVVETVLSMPDTIWEDMRRGIAASGRTVQGL